MEEVAIFGTCLLIGGLVWIVMSYFMRMKIIYNGKYFGHFGYLIKILRTQGTPIPTNDIWIAASTMETGSILLSSDKHFNDVPGLMVLDY